MADKREVKTLVVTDNVPTGCVVSLAGIDPLLSFASLFREELQARGWGVLPKKEGGDARQGVD